MSWVKIIARVFPFQNVRYRATRFHWITLRQQVGVFVVVAKEALGRGVFLDEGQVPGDSEARFAPGSKEFIGLVPAIKAHAEAIPTEHAINFPESRFNPGVVIVVGDGAPIPGNCRTAECLRILC